jgi:hypothetical protein
VSQANAGPSDTLSELYAYAIELSPYSNAVTRNMIESQIERRGQSNGIMH